MIPIDRRVLRLWFGMLLACVMMTLGLVACDTGIGRESGDNLVPAEVELLDGRTVMCVFDRWSQRGGVSCDWESAR